jgi:large subunit ribosomal protein L30
MAEDSDSQENDGRKVELKKEGARRREGVSDTFQPLTPSSQHPPSVKERKPRAPRKPKTTAKEGVRKPAAPRKPAVRKPKPEKVPEAPKEKETPRHEKLFAVVMVRGVVGTDSRLRSTLMMLRLHRINHCVIVPKNQNYDGMLHKARDFITWGEIDRETLEKLISKRGRFAGDKRVADLNYAKELAQFILSGKPVRETGIKPVFRLSPPSKGYKSTKALYPKGSLGYRGEKINELIKRMI